MGSLYDKVQKLDEVSRGSKYYEFDEQVLTMTGWLSGERVRVDFSALVGVLYNLLDQGEEGSVEMILCAYDEKEEYE